MMKLLKNCRLYAPRDEGMDHLLVAGESIVLRGKAAAQMDGMQGVDVCDMEGRVVIPGLVDCHAHITGGGGEDGPESRVPAVELGAFTSAGVTSVVGLLGTDDLVRTTGELVVRARALVAEGLSAWCYTGGYHVPPVTLTGNIRGDIVHVDRIVGVGELAISDHRSSHPTDQELIRIAGEAHVGGLMAGKAGLVHLHLGDGKQGMEPLFRILRDSDLPPRVLQPTHINRHPSLLDEALKAARLGCHVDITAFPDDPDHADVLASDALARYLDEEGPAERISVSSDGGGCLPHFDERGHLHSMDVGRPETLFRTLQTLLQAGRAPEQVLPAFTSNPAALLRLPGKGRLDLGMDADLVVMNEDFSVCHVMARGEWHWRNGQQSRFGTFEARPESMQE
jgi:beta-aspartyl-dipeptidase (metallo-type)